MSFYVMGAMAIAGAVSANDSYNNEIENEKKSVDRAAATEKYSYITGNKAGPIQRAKGTQLSSIMGGALSGAAAGQGMGGLFGEGGGGGNTGGTGSTSGGGSMKADTSGFYSNSLGAQDYSNQLGQYGQNISEPFSNGSQSNPNNSQYASLKFRKYGS